MRTIVYAIFDKETKTREYTHWNIYKIHEKLETMENKEKYEIRHKWMSF